MSDRLDWDLPHKKLLNIQTCPLPTNFAHKLETGVKNGDCLPACFSALLECMHRGRITSRNLETPAFEMRNEIIKWAKENWTTCPIFQPSMPVHELVWMQHALGVTQEEQEKMEEWGSSPDERLVQYNKICGKVYFSDVEMLIFACMMYERSIPVFFRVWRVTGLRQDVGTLVHTLPDKSFYTSSGIEDAVVVDLAHTGSIDQSTAHYKLLSSASIQGLTVCGKKRDR